MKLPKVLILLVTLLAFGLRLIALNTLPPVLGFDEAPNGIDALYLLRLHRLTPFLQNQSGRETLFFYLQGLALSLYGISFFSLRFVPALLGTLTIPLIFRVGRCLARDMLADQVHWNRRNLVDWTGLAAAAGLAVAYWHLYYSRLALRAISLPPLLLGIIWCFWRGWSGRRRGWLMGAGFLLGLAAYTYLAARLLPILFLLFVALDLAGDRTDWRARLVDFCLFGGIAALVAAPLGFYFWNHPQAFYGRAQDISIFELAQPGLTLLSNLANLLQIHFLGGSRLGRWPALDPLAALGLACGLALCIYAWRRPAARLLLLWWGIGALPVLMSVQVWERDTIILRGIAAWPAIFIISAFGLVRLAEQISRRRSWPPTRLYAWLLVLLLCLGGGYTVYNYFWIRAAAYQARNDTRPVYWGQYLNAQTGQLTLIPFELYTDPVLHFLLQAHYPAWRNAGVEHLPALLDLKPLALFLPNDQPEASLWVLLVPGAENRGAAYLLPRLTPDRQARLMAAATSPVAQIRTPGGVVVGQVYPLARDLLSFESPPSLQPVQANFNHELSLVGYHFEPARVKPGATTKLFLMWQVQRPIDGYYFIFLHLFDVAQRRRWAQINTYLMGAARWPIGVTVPRLIEFELPPGAPAGPYRVEVGVYHGASLARLPRLDPNGQVIDDKIVIGNLQVQQQPAAPPAYPLVDLIFGRQIQLTGIDLAQTSLQPGQVLTYTLYWQATKAPDRDYTVFNHLLDARGRLVLGQDNFPLRNQYPTSWWNPGEIVRDPYTLSLPPDLEPGRYTLRVGLYQVDTGERLRLNGGPQDFVDIPLELRVTLP